MFKYPIYFVQHSAAKWRDLVEADEVPTAEVYGPRLREGDDNWTVQTYFELKRRGYNVAYVAHMVPDAICVAHYDDIWLKELPFRTFIVASRPDRPAAPLAHIRIVQNKLAVHGPDDFFMPHWTHPGLLPRAVARGHRIEQITYAGVAYNLKSEYRDADFRRRLDELGMRLEIRETDFHDYRNVDVVLAVRPGTLYDINLKPASKLQNAWLAGCPAVLGPESGFQQYRQSDLDYIEVATPDEALAAFQRLKKEPGLFQQMVENGLRRGQDYTHEAIAQRWIDLLAGPVTGAFERWRRKRRSPAGLVELPRFGARLARHKLARYVHQRRI